MDITTMRSTISARARDTCSSASFARSGQAVLEQAPAEPLSAQGAKRANHPASQSIASVLDFVAPVSMNRSSSDAPLVPPARSSAIDPCATSRPRWMMPM